jgi:hypothetical protein
MDDKDHVFARFKDHKSASAERHERLSIPGRGAGSSSPSVVVVHLRTRAPTAPQDRTRYTDRQLRAASWEDGFPATPTTRAPGSLRPDLVAPLKPAAHVMPAWTPTSAEVEVAAQAVAEAPPIVFPAAPSLHPRHAHRRRVVDPFDPADDGANCLRCGYAIEPAREKRGLMICAGCG